MKTSTDAWPGKDTGRRNKTLVSGCAFLPLLGGFRVGIGGGMAKLVPFLALLTVPIKLLNLFGTVASGLWLAILGVWWAIGYGVALLLVSIFGLSIALMPGVALGVPARYFLSRGQNAAAYPFAFLSTMYTYAVMTVWSVWVLNLFVQHATPGSLFPLVVWSYGSATGPWTYFASKERDNYASGIAAVAAQVGYLLIMLMVLIFNPSLLDVTIAFGAVMTVALLLQFGLAVAVARTQAA
jgi:hypothetical protein